MIVTVMINHPFDNSDRDSRCAVRRYVYSIMRTPPSQGISVCAMSHFTPLTSPHRRGITRGRDNDKGCHDISGLSARLAHRQVLPYASIPCPNHPSAALTSDPIYHVV